MATEIERKFIVPLEYHDAFLQRRDGTRQIQAYLSEEPTRTVRLRLSYSPDGVSAKMTVKGKARSKGLVRPEWEWDMPVDMVQDMITTLNPPSLDKTRYLVDDNGYIWEVDVLRVNTVAGRPPQMWRYLVTAEIEAPTAAAAHAVPIPHWVGKEVTGDTRFAMSMLLNEDSREAAYRAAYGR